MLHRDDSLGVFCFEEAFVAFDQILVDALKQGGASSRHLVDAGFEVSLLLADRGDLGVVFRLVLGVGLVSGGELRRESLGFLH